MNTTSEHTAAPVGTSKTGYNRFLLLVAGLGGLLYGVDVGIIAGALPYLEATSGLNAGQLSFIVAAVLLGSVISTLFAGMLADWMGRKKLMALSGVLFVASIPMIALAHGYGPLVFGPVAAGRQRRIDRRGRAAVSGGMPGRLEPRQGHRHFPMAADAGHRGGGGASACTSASGWTQWPNWATRTRLFAFKDTAWRSIFWVSLPPGILFVIGSLMVAESPRWLFRRGRKDAARAALLRSRSDEQAEVELKEMEETAAAEKAKTDDRRPEGQGIAAASQIRHPVRAGLRHSGLQPGHRRQLDHRLQRHHSHSGRL